MDRERLEELNDILDELVRTNFTTPIIVEGKKDRAALRSLGCEGVILEINTGRSVVNLASEISRRSDHVVILTDWDRKGGHLARLLTGAFDTIAVTYNMAIRKALARVSHKEIHDVESLPRLLENLVSRVNTAGHRDRKFDRSDDTGGPFGNGPDRSS